MQITATHTNAVIAFAGFSGVFYFTDSIILAVVFALGMWHSMKKFEQAKKDWNEESIDPSKTAN